MMPGFLRAEATYRTRLLQLVVVAVTALFAVVLAAHTLLTKADRLAYTNNVPTKVTAASIAPHERMCRGLLLLPAGSKELRLVVLTGGKPGPPLAMTLQTPTQTTRSSLAGGYGDGALQSFRFSGVTGTAQSRLCVTNEGRTPAAFGGVAWTTTEGSVLRAAGKKVPGDLSIDIYGGHRRLADIVPDIMRRAAVWAPSWVGPWTYYLLFALGLGIVATAVALVLVGGRASSEEVASGARRRFGLPRAVRRLPRSPSSTGLHGRCSYCRGRVRTRSRTSPMCNTSRRPEASPRGAVRMVAPIRSSTSSRWSSRSRTRCDRTPSRGPRGETRTAGAGRTCTTHENPSRTNGGAATGYSPEYYALASVGYLAFDWGDIFERQFGARLISALLGAVTVIFAWLFARELFRREGWLPNTAALSAALLPQFGFISGIVNNDSLAIALGAVMLYLLARGIGRVSPSDRAS